MSAIDALVIDYGGVLTTPLAEAMASFAQDEGIDLQEFVRASLGAYSEGGDELVVGFETGTLSEEDFSEAFAARLSQISPAPILPQGLIQRIWGRLKLEETMLTMVGLAREAGLKTALLSNSWGVDYYPRDRLQALFDVQVISGEVGLRKPDPEIYRLTVERLGVPADRCVFVDDHPGHLKAAKAAGMATVLHRTPAETVSELEGLLSITLT